LKRYPLTFKPYRIARAVGDLFLARADGSPQRFYSLSAQIQRERKAYYDTLGRTQRQSMDVTEWLAWFLSTLGWAQHQLRTERLTSVVQPLRRPAGPVEGGRRDPDRHRRAPNLKPTR
jgi:hypothetical protein